MKIERIAKKISDMRGDELLAFGLSSFPNAIKTCQYLYGLSGSQNLKKYVVNGMAQVAALVNQPAIRKFMVRTFAELTPTPYTPTSLESFLDNLLPNSLPKDEQGELIMAALKTPESRMGTILAMHKNTPPEMVNRLFTENGFVGTPLHNDAAKQKLFLQRMHNELAIGTPWENEQSGTLIGMRLLKNKNDETVRSFVNAGSVFPETLITAINQFGPDQLKKEVAKKSPSFSVAIESINNTHEQNEKLAIALNFFHNPSVRAEKKSALMEWLAKEQPKEVFQPAISEFSALPTEETFITAIGLLRDGICFDVHALTSNHTLAMFYADTLQNLLEQKGLLSTAAPDFLNYIERKKMLESIPQGAEFDPESILFQAEYF